MTLNFVEDRTKQSMSEYEEAVVLDSEDEERQGTKESSVSNSLSCDKACRSIEKNASLFSTNTDFHQGLKGSSLNSTESVNEKRLVAKLHANELDFVRLSYVCSQEPSESSEATALEFVNQFLMSGYVGSSPETDFRKTVRLTSSHVSSAKGSHSLSKRIKPRTSIAQIGTFEWFDNDQQEGRGFGENMRETSFDFRGSEDGSSTRCKKTKHLNYKTGCNKANEDGDFLNDQKCTTGVIHAGEHLADIGIDTQIAAEAMESLFNGPSPPCNALNVHPGPENTPKSLKTKAHVLKQAFLEKSASSDSRSLSKNATRRNHSARKVCRRFPSSASKKSKNTEWYPESAINTRERLTHVNKQGKTEVTISMNNNEERHNSLKLDEQISLGDGQLLGKPVGQQVGLRERVCGVSEKSLLTYNRKRRHSFPNTFKVHCVAEKCPRSCSTAPEESRNGKREQQEQTGVHVTFGLKPDGWNYPRRKRSCLKIQSHSNEVSSAYAPLATDDGKESKNTYVHGSTIVSCAEGVNMASLKNIPNEYCTRPCNKAPPKSFLLKELIRLGVPKSMPDFMCRSVKRRRNMAYVRILFSQHLNDDTIKQQKKILARLGLISVSSSSDATHFIANRFVRTRNMLEALALGKPVVTSSWLQSCGQAACLIDEKNYILRDAKKEKEIGFSLPVSLARASQHPLLQGKTVFITPNVKPDKEMIISLIETVHGQAIEANPMPWENDQKIPDESLVLSCEEDQAICEPFIIKGVAVYSSELLLNGIIIQKLEFERHKLFVTNVKRNRRINRRSRA